MKKLLLLAMMLFFTAMFTRVQATNEIDIGIYATSCSDFEVRLSSQFNITNTSLTNVQFAIKYPALVTIGDITYLHPVGLQYTITEGAFKYSVFVGENISINNWVAGTQYGIIQFTTDHAASSTLELIIGNDTWTSSHNAMYYAELLGLNKTGVILTGATVNLLVHNTDLGRYYCKIQEAVDDASVNQTIEVSTGTFNENVTIDVAGLILKNAVSASPVIRPTTGIAIHITADYVTLDGFAINHATPDGADDIGVLVENPSDHCVIQNNVISSNSAGIELLDAGDNNINHNELAYNFAGIYLEGTTDGLGHYDGGSNGPFYSLSLNNDITYNNIHHSFTIDVNTGFGIYLDAACEGNLIDHNTISTNGRIGYYAWKASNNEITNNTVSGNLLEGIEIMGSSGNTITGNIVEDNVNYGLYIEAGALSSTLNNITGNTINNNGTGIILKDSQEPGYVGVVTGNTISNNKIYDNTSYGLLTEGTPVGEIYVAENNWWGDPSGPYCNPYNTCGLGNDVSANVDFMPWWEDEAMTISSGDLPVINVTNSPNTYYCKIQDAIDDADDGDEIHVAAGNYNESMDIAKPLTILGSGNTTTIIDRSADATAGDIVYIHDLNGNLIVDGFTFKTGPASAINSNGVHIVNISGGTCTISNNIIVAFQSTDGTAMENYGVIAGYGSTAKLIFDNNTVYGGGSNPVLIERWLGLTEITDNIIYRGPEIVTDGTGKDAIFMMNYNTDNINLQLISGNTINMSGGTYNSGNRGVGITVATAVNSTTPAMFTDVEISGNTILNLNTNRRGISTWNNAPSGSGAAGDIQVIIMNNEITSASGYTGEFGIRILGLSTVADILNNKINGVTDAVKIQPWNNHSASGVAVNNNYLGYTTGYGINNLTSNLADGTCNWFENNGVHAIYGPVTYVPYLNDGTDGSGDIGFQPTGSCITPADFYVNDNSTLNDRFTSAIGNDANMGTITSPLATINKAISLAATANNIWVDAGTYVEDVAIDKAVNLLGSNYDVDPNGLNPRNEEARILPAHNSPYDDALISVETSNVNIKGLYFDGDNPAITGGEDVMGVDVNMSDGIQNGPTWGTYFQINHLNVENNIFKNFTYDGIFLWETFGVNQSWNYLHHNYFENMWEGIQTYAMHADISDNVFFSVNRGISMHGVSAAADALFIPRIANNDVTIDWTNPYNDFEIGIWVNYRIGSAPDLDVTNNTITCPTGSIPTGKNFSGLYVMTISNDRKVTFTGNIVNGNGICNTGLYAGNISSNYVRLTGGSLNNIKENGVIADNYNEVSQYKVAADVKITVDNVPITMGNTGAGIKAYGNPLGAGKLASVSVMNDCDITGGAQGILATGDGASVTVTDNDATISGNDIGILISSLGDLISCTGNTITGNDNGGIIIESTAGTIGDIIENTISGNGYSYDSEHGLGILNAKGTSVNATNNYWGHATGPYRLSDNSCGQGNAVSENVDICMWYTNVAMTPADLNGCVILIFNVTGGGEYCFGGTGVLVGLDDSEVGVNYQLYQGINLAGIPVAGDGDDISFGYQTVGGIYTVKATNTYTGCSDVLMTGSATVTVNPLPAAPTAGNVNVVYDGLLHTGSATAPTGSSVVWFNASTGGSVTVAPSGTATGTYSAWAESEDDLTGCISSSRTQVTVTISPVTLGLKVLLQGPYEPFTCGSNFTDNRDAQVYSTVQIGTQCWMAENLNIGTKINGTSDQTNNSTIEKYCYDNSTSNCDTYGGLYQWNEMMQYVTTEGTQGICPNGWHVPTDAEYCTLTQFIDLTVNCGATGWSGTNVSTKMKSTTGWAGGGNGTNTSGFTALPGGLRLTDGSFGGLTINAHFWSSSESVANARYRALNNSNAAISRDSGDKSYGFSVRCIKDVPTLGMMKTDLNSVGQIHSAQPFNTSPWNYYGSEVLPTPLPADVVDWVLVELRTGTGSGTMIGRSAALLNSNGTVNISINNVSFPDVVSGSAYYIVIWHRNHMPVMSASAITVPVTSYDFTVPGNLYGTNPAIDLGDGTYGLIAGDVTKNGMLKYSGPNNDRGPIIARIVAETGSNNTNGFTPAGYWQEDVTMNSIVLYLGSGNDRGIIQVNLLTLTGTPYLNNTYTSVVPGAYTGGKDGMDEGPVDIQFMETAENLAIEIVTNEQLINGMVDNIQFTLSWNAGDTEIEQLLSTLTSGFNLQPQGDVVEVDGINYLIYVSVTPTYLPQAWNSGETVTVLTFEKEYGQLISNRLWIADNDFTISNNGEYYVSNWGCDVTGIIYNSTVGIETTDDGFVKLYPNPVTNGNLFLQVNTVQSENLAVEIWDMTGKLIKKIDYHDVSGTMTYSVNVSEFNSGVYLINVIGDKVLYKDRFIVK